MNSSKINLPLLVLTLLSLAACGRFSPGSPTVVEVSGVPGNEEVTQVVADPEATAQPTLPPGGTLILADGQVVAMNPALPLSFATNGRLLTIEVTPGDAVMPGDLVATLDDEKLQEAVTSAEIQVAVAENSLAQSQLSLDALLDWEVDEEALALAEANLAAAEAGYEAALARDATASDSLTSSRISLQQAQRRLADAQEAYDTAFDPGREWELHVAEPSCLPGQGGNVPCTGPFYNVKLENERLGAERAVTGAQEGLAIAQANYNLAVSSLDENSALQAAAAVASAEQALSQAQKGPESTDIAAAELRVEQAELTLQQSEFSLQQARRALDNAELLSPWQGEVFSVDAVLGSLVSSGLPIVTLMHRQHLAFHTTNLSERDLAQIAPGQSAEITLRTYPGRIIPGRVVRIQPQASGQVGDAATFTVVISFDESDLAILAGMTGRVEIQAVPEPAD